MTWGTTPRVLLVVALVGSSLGLAGPAALSSANAAVISTPTATPKATSPGAPSATPTPAAGISASTSLGAAAPGTIITVYGAGWPARITIQASTCGNNAIAGATDCSQQGAGSTVTNPDGSFRLDMPIAKPPKPCPCVIHVVSPDTTAKVDQPFVVKGQATGPLVIDQTTRTLEATARLTGSGPVTAWLGGAAKRTFVLTIRNTGNTPITNPGLTLTVGKGSDPTKLLASPKVGTILAGTTVVYKLPVTLAAPAFGQYTVKAYFSDLDNPVTTSARTSSYPWLLFLLGWLLLQPLLLGLYNRRPVLEEGDDDPFSDQSHVDLPPLAPVAGAVFIAGIDDDPLNAHHAPAYGAPAVVGAAAAVGATRAIVPRPATALVPNYRPVFGVTDLRAYLDPYGVTPQASVAPRIVLGGIVPTYNTTAPAQNGHAPQE